MAVPRKNLPQTRPVYRSDLTRTERRRQMRASRLSEEKRKVLNWAQRLTFIADEMKDSEYQELRAELLKVIDRARTLSSHTEEKDYEQVLDAITNHQCNCVYDIHEQTRIPQAQIWKILDGLLATKQIVEHIRGAGGGRARDAFDTLFYPTGSPAFSPMVRP
ncbi:MAG: hypothetical protein M3362_22375 [Acidobacteriota bacterium]|nr:hypothetical protein [Acidobacteriota bacterium]